MQPADAPLRGERSHVVLLNKTFGVSLFKKGIPVGTAKVVACF